MQVCCLSLYTNLHRLQKYPDYSSGSVGGKLESALAATNVYACYSKFRSIRANTTTGSTAAATVPAGFLKPVSVETTSTSFIKSEVPGPSTSAGTYRTLTARSTSTSLPTMVKPKLTGVFYKDDASSSTFGELLFMSLLSSSKRSREIAILCSIWKRAQQ